MDFLEMTHQDREKYGRGIDKFSRTLNFLLEREREKGGKKLFGKG